MLEGIGNAGCDESGGAGFCGHGVGKGESDTAVEPEAGAAPEAEALCDDDPPHPAKPKTSESHRASRFIKRDECFALIIVCGTSA
jgi:hypothetical protein